MFRDSLGLVIVGILVTVNAQAAFKSTCSLSYCVTGWKCKEVYTPSLGIIRAECLAGITPPTGNEEICMSGQPLYLNTTRGYAEASCWGSAGSITCPPGYSCNARPYDENTVCCPEIEFKDTSEDNSVSPRSSGECPAPTSLGCDSQNDCRDDTDCYGDHRCCVNRCGGFTCTPPSPSAGQSTQAQSRSSPCQTLKCPSNQQCVTEEIICVRGPCNNKGSKDRCISFTAPREKPGLCPVSGSSSSSGTCETETTCGQDEECQGSRKCCRTPCGGFVCRTPTSGTTSGSNSGIADPSSCQTISCSPGSVCVRMQPSDCVRQGPCQEEPRCIPVQKPGVCPLVASDTRSYVWLPSCTRLCETDADCPLRQKCCTGVDKCGTSCQVPQSESQCDAIRCQSGYQCVMKQPVGCKSGLTCSDVPMCVPIKKEGLCPAVTPRDRFGATSNCANRCGSDKDCVQFQKCCMHPDGCGTVCREPEPEVTCANSKCATGQQCVMVPAQNCEYRSSPCFGQPLCVSLSP